MVGDIMQRIGDHDRVEAFMTGTSINTLFSFVNFIVFGFVLAYYDWTILGLFLVGNGLYFHEMEEGAGRKAFLAGGRGTKQPIPAHHRHAGDQAE